MYAAPHAATKQPSAGVQALHRTHAAVSGACVTGDSHGPVLHLRPVCASFCACLVPVGQRASTKMHRTRVQLLFRRDTVRRVLMRLERCLKAQ